MTAVLSQCSGVRKSVFRIALGTILCVLALPAHAQQTGKVFRIGFLENSTASGTAVFLEAFRQELNKLGWIEGKNIVIEQRFGENKGAAYYRELAAELISFQGRPNSCHNDVNGVSGQECHFNRSYRDDKSWRSRRCRIGY